MGLNHKNQPSSSDLQTEILSKQKELEEKQQLFNSQIQIFIDQILPKLKEFGIEDIVYSGFLINVLENDEKTPISNFLARRGELIFGDQRQIKINEISKIPDDIKSLSYKIFELEKDIKKLQGVLEQLNTKLSLERESQSKWYNNIINRISGLSRDTIDLEQNSAQKQES